MACPRGVGRWGGEDLIEETQSKDTFKYVQ